MATPYIQITEDVAVDGNGSQPVNTSRWLKKVMTLGVSCLVVLAIVNASTSTFSLRSTNAAESTNLLGVSPSLRSPFGGVAKNGVMNPMVNSIASSPMAKLAITAIQMNHLNNLGVRDVSMEAQMKTVWATADKDTKEAAEEVTKKVELKAKDIAGVTAPFGLFDPLGFSTDVSEGRLLFLREAELKHGRVCMLASVGILVGEKFHPLFGGDIDVPAYVAFQQTPLQTFWVAVLAAIGALELPSINTFNFPAPSNEWSLREGRIPGDFGFDPLGLKPKNAKEFKEIQTKEINNGRLAMIAAAGMIAQELVDGQKITVR